MFKSSTDVQKSTQLEPRLTLRAYTKCILKAKCELPIYAYNIMIRIFVRIMFLNRERFELRSAEVIVRVK